MNVKIFSCQKPYVDISDFERKINNFMATVEVIDVKFTTTYEDGIALEINVLVLYK